MTTKIFSRILFLLFLLLLLSALGLLTSCKSVRKSQNAKLETATVKRSDSSKTQTVTYIDTTNTDSSTETTTTTITADSVEYYYPSDLYRPYSMAIDLPIRRIAGTHSSIKAKGVTISIINKKQTAIKANGVTTKTETKQNDIKADSNFTKSEVVKTIEKKPSIRTGIGLVFGFALLVGLIWLIIWVWRRKKAIIEKVL